MTALKWALAALTAVALATRADAQLQPGTRPAPKPPTPFPSVNSWPGIPAQSINPPLYNPGPFYNPALNNPFLNQTQVIPFTPLANTLNNPLAPNAWANFPFAPQTCIGGAGILPGGCIGFQGPFTTYTPPLAVQQPGQLLWRGPDLQVNPVSGMVYRPLSGVAQARDGSVFYRVAGSGLPTFTGAYAPGTGLYFDPQRNTFLNPGTGVISRPGTTNIFVPWIPPGTRW